MVFVELLGFLMAVVLVSLGFTQVLVPIIRGKRLFPMFHRQPKELIGLTEKMNQEELAAEIVRREEELEKLRKRNKEKFGKEIERVREKL